MPEGYGVPTHTRGMMPWTGAKKILEGARSYWLVTLDPDGKPHVVGQWGAWIDDRWYFEGSPETVWARNVARDGRVAMSTESGTTAVMVEGRAERLPTVDRDTSQRITKQYGAKYGRVYKYRPKPEQWDKGGYVLRPSKILAWDVRGFPRNSTRFVF
jgi:hypothetical protein